jgi:hypothetical protein
MMASHNFTYNMGIKKLFDIRNCCIDTVSSVVVKVCQTDSIFKNILMNTHSEMLHWCQFSGRSFRKKVSSKLVSTGSILFLLQDIGACFSVMALDFRLI